MCTICRKDFDPNNVLKLKDHVEEYIVPNNHWIVSEVIDFREKDLDEFEYQVKWEGYEE